MTQAPNDSAVSELSSVHTNGFTELLSHFGISIAITTYQAGKLILARADGTTTNDDGYILAEHVFELLVETGVL